MGIGYQAVWLAVDAPALRLDASAPASSPGSCVGVLLVHPPTSRWPGRPGGYRRVTAYSAKSRASKAWRLGHRAIAAGRGRRVGRLISVEINSFSFSSSLTSALAAPRSNARSTAWLWASTSSRRVDQPFARPVAVPKPAGAARLDTPGMPSSPMTPGPRSWYHRCAPGSTARRGCAQHHHQPPSRSPRPPPPDAEGAEPPPRSKPPSRPPTRRDLPRRAWGAAEPPCCDSRLDLPEQFSSRALVFMVSALLWAVRQTHQQ